MLAIDIDIPGNCWECNFFGEDSWATCDVNGMELGEAKEYLAERHKDCPLQEMKLHRHGERVDLYEVRRKKKLEVNE